jgi:hypothetical protein
MKFESGCWRAIWLRRTGWVLVFFEVLLLWDRNRSYALSGVAMLSFGLAYDLERLYGPTSPPPADTSGT